jgi:sulfide:quinone oxidoreductase
MTATRVLVLGAGFGGLLLSTVLSEELGDEVEVTLIDKGDAFVFGYSKLDVMFGRETLDAVRLPYSDFAKPGVRLLREQVTAIDPEGRRVSTDNGDYEADVLVVALGADYDVAATPGLADSNEFYSVAGAERMREVLPEFSGGRAVIGVCGAPFKCPPAPSEAALLLHDQLVDRGIRDECQITILMPLPSPVPPSPETSRALLAAFEQRGIEFVPGARIKSLDDAAKLVALEDGSEVTYDLFLGVPKHRAPEVVLDSGMAEDGYIPVDSSTLKTRFAGVYAVGDVATVGVPKAGVFAERAAKVVAAQVVSQIRGEGDPEGFDGRGSCYIEFGDGLVGRVDVDFLSGPNPTGVYSEPSTAIVAEKQEFGSSRRARWFGR